MQFSITKELLLESSWTKVFAKVKADSMEMEDLERGWAVALERM